jgi:hypothetical protein
MAKSTKPPGAGRDRAPAGATKADATLASEFAGLARSPTTDDEREQVNRRAARFKAFPQLDDAEAQALFDQIRDLRRAALRSATGGEKEELEAQRLMTRLFEGVGGWAYARRLPHLLFRTANNISAMIPQVQRQVASDCLKTPLPILPPPIRYAIAQALDALDNNIVDPILEPLKGGRRGSDRSARGEMEEYLLAWIEWQGAQGPGRITRARNDVAAACGVSLQAIDKWKKNLAYHGMLENAAAIGRIEAAGGDPSDIPRLAELYKLLQSLDMPSAVARWEKARQPRPT